MSTRQFPLRTERPLSANRLAQYATRRGRCERYLRFTLFPSEEQALRRRYDVASEPLSPLLSGEGLWFEREMVAALEERVVVRDLTDADAGAFISAMASQADGIVFYYQPYLRGLIGEWPCEGRADLIEINRSGSRVRATVIDIKASRRESVGFRLQVAFYARLLGGAVNDAGLALEQIEGAILSREADWAETPFKRFELALYDDEIDRLIGAPGSDVSRVVSKRLADTRYHLNPKCDGCQFNPVCFIETAEGEDLSLVPHLTGVEKRALQSAGVRNVRDLAGLMEYGANEMVPAPGCEARIERVSSRWPLGGRLPLLVQRARAALHRYDETCEAKPYLLGAVFSTLPSTERYPDLVKIFIDVERDYINDRLYLIATRVEGPRGVEEIAEMTPQPPEDDRNGGEGRERGNGGNAIERELVLRWLGQLFPAIRRVAAGQMAPLHVYLYDRRDERGLLEALLRHFERLAALPAFYDLLTSTQAHPQQMISFLADEARLRWNLAPICQNLYRVARVFGFDWQEGGIAFWQRFRARAFDSQRAYIRDLQTGLLRPASRNESGYVHYVESAARYGTQIPLEYAYTAWGRLKLRSDLDAQERALLRGFEGVTVEEIRQFALHRTRAMAYLEKRMATRQAMVEKEPVPVGSLDQVIAEQEAKPLHDALADFLLLEHHARMQELQLHFDAPPELRAQTGRTLLVEFERMESDARGETARFGYVVKPDLDALSLRSGDWVVVNSGADAQGQPRTGRRIMYGQLATIERLEADGVTLRMLPLNFRDSKFRYRHAVVPLREGARYTIDESADDINADKYLDACRHATENPLYRWMSDVETGRSQRRVRPSRLRRAAQFAETASRAQAPEGLTAAQRRLVGDCYLDRVLVVQGPPGTGKSHTIGLAILARMLAQKSSARSFRVAVAARTHAATEIVLSSVASRLRELRAAFPEEMAPLDSLRIVKVTRTEDEPLPEGVEGLPIYGRSSAALEWLSLLSRPFVVVGGTPGGLYTLVKQGAGEIDWTREYFDLVVVDEASQMGIAEALAAAAFLRSDGQFIAVGDHRQMPPILAHAWEDEARRDLKQARPHLSIFEYLKRLGFPQAPLDESFRIPEEIAGFLRRHVYAADGIDFRSRRRSRIERIDALEGWLAAAFAPEHPMILIEHEEESSQQANHYEAELAAELAEAAMKHLGLDAERGLGIVVPHRAQKALLAARIPGLAGAIDTVERFQGGEREMIIVSATVSDREYAQAESRFLLDPRRLTVAISRPKRKLVVVASRSVFDLIAQDVDEYERGALWKRLYHEAKESVLWEGEISGHRLRVRRIGEEDR